MRLKKYLVVETTIDIDQRDIKMIYAPLQKYMRKLTENVKTHNIPALKKTLIQIRKDGEYVGGPRIGEAWLLKRIKSSELKSLSARMADKINPITIFVGFTKDEPFYEPEMKIILVGLPLANLDWLIEPGSLEHIQDTDFLPFFKNFHSEQSAKQMIRHELTHWIDDSLRNRHILKKGLAGKLSKGAGAESANTPIEMEAQISQVEQLKSDLGEKYWSLTWQQFLKQIPDISSTIQEVPGFKKLFLKRMWRENLFTDKMRQTLK
jgi:hypothetical protein